ncbi:MAG: glycosyltransferase family 2 protein [Candidatus Omnitrophica bacterium]|nr:glycosyltransferase family 2 protein [Candidatus Omnitrophota bacterium]
MNEARGYSIVIPVYNGEETLPDTLRSVMNLEYESYEVIVVDDGSCDDSAGLARRHGAAVIRLEANQGPAHARNVGAAHAAFDIVLFTDSDVLLRKGALIKLDERFRESGADAVQGTFSEVCPFADYFSQYKNLYNRFVLNRLPDWIDTTFTSITAVKKSAFLECGGFDANIRGASVEDRTLGRNLIRKGFRIRLDRSIEVVHNKKLTWLGFLRNQFRRSRDLAKLLLRNRAPQTNDLQEISSFAEEGRFGTNSLSTMARIPIAYTMLALIALSVMEPTFGILALACFAVFLGMIFPFECELIKKKKLSFALVGIGVNFVDALVSGMGIVVGFVEYFGFNKKY